MYERTRSSSSAYHSGYSNPTTKMASDIGPRKTLFVLVVVVGCFAILWPKVFYPMLVGSANQHMKPSPIDKTTGCCDVFSETDINTIKIMSELCSSIIQQSSEKTPLSGKEIVAKCRKEVQETCGIDISAVLQDQIRFGRTVKQILNEIRSLNGSLCLKYHYGVAPWRLGVPHRIAVNVSSSVRQERPPHMRPDIIHPAFRERGSAIPRLGTSKKKIVEGRPGPIPGMRPTLGGAGRVVAPSQKTGSSMSVIMPIYTIGIVIFFTYTLMKLLFKKQPDGVGGSLYPPVEPDPRFRREVFESERSRYTPRLSRDPTGKIVVNAMSALLDEVDGEIEARRNTNLFVNQEIYLQGALPAQSQILVSDSAIVTEAAPNNVNYDPAVVLAGKMTLSVISLDGAHTGERAADRETIPSISVQTPEMVDLNEDGANNEEDAAEESKYTTASSATVAEPDVSEDEGTDNEIMKEDIERINLEMEINHVPTATNGVDLEEELARAAEDFDYNLGDKVEEELVVEEEEKSPVEKVKEVLQPENGNSCLASKEEETKKKIVNESGPAEEGKATEVREELPEVGKNEEKGEAIEIDDGIERLRVDVKEKVSEEKQIETEIANEEETVKIELIEDLEEHVAKIQIETPKKAETIKQEDATEILKTFEINTEKKDESVVEQKEEEQSKESSAVPETHFIRKEVPLAIDKNEATSPRLEKEVPTQNNSITKSGDDTEKREETKGDLTVAPIREPTRGEESSSTNHEAEKEDKKQKVVEIQARDELEVGDEEEVDDDEEVEEEEVEEEEEEIEEVEVTDDEEVEEIEIEIEDEINGQETEQ